ncbi:MAG: hypothetical protein K0U86_13510 [Planctomycetes bacterium]|nr:hypothetical protein [Planctomycetota bacterium]MCH9725909.1 hypothetical protein [Planctomycetota bacterium]MCH9777062.1 hypothetical protein [Planctomycetota bacterium]MCH9789976.1 hypothetical protein [Planctomycetota bacterium]MDF1743970.1 hypothetical protein [Gimesia sp.]
MKLQIASFRFDVTPPLGHSLCGGWIPAAAQIEDSLEAIGLVLLSEQRPIVICSVDWTGLCNTAHYQLREALANAAGTSAERVAVQCVHQHDAPFACLETDRIVRAQGDLPPNMDPEFFKVCLKRADSAVRKSLKTARRLTHIAAAESKVEQVASNRRLLDDSGKILKNRSVAASSDDVRDLPTGVIDPWLKTVAFYDGREKVAACYYYAVHPISYCCQEGHVTSEFVGHARRLKEQHDSPDCTHLYFTGCAGNINTGKFNNSSHKENRQVLTQRVFEAMEQASEKLRPEPINNLSWKTTDFLPPVNKTFSAAQIEKQINDHSRRVVHRNRPAFTLAWLRRHAQKTPIILSALHVNQISLLHLPAEPFVEYQLRTQVLQPDRFVATAGYGDGGPWYIPTSEAYFQGGYEVNVAFSGPQVDGLLMKGIQTLFKS